MRCAAPGWRRNGSSKRRLGNRSRLERFGPRELIGGETGEAREITHLSFADWVYFIFDHPAEGPQWYWANDAPFWNAFCELDEMLGL